MISNAHQLPSIRNRILTTLSLQDFDPLRPLLQSVLLEDGCVLSEHGKRIEYVNFVETGLVSLMTLASGSMLETAMVGFHGAVGASVVLGAKTSMHRSVVSIPGKAWRIRVEDLQRVTGERPQIREHLLRYLESLMIHGSQTALCGVRHELSRRLACWLCLACESLGSETVSITHDHLSFIMGLRRAGVTEALTRFEEVGLVRKSRGVLQVRDRLPLQRHACGCYEVIARSYGWRRSESGSCDVPSSVLINGLPARQDFLGDPRS
ncbi:CRP-like cAMP-binding protein [Bradyrhizobium diazoefficiens]